MSHTPSFSSMPLVILPESPPIPAWGAEIQVVVTAGRCRDGGMLGTEAMWKHSPTLLYGNVPE